MKLPSKDLPIIRYWKLVLLDKSDDKELFEFLINYGNTYKDESEVDFIRGDKLGSEFLRRIYSEKDPLTIVLKIHLILEIFINEISKKHKLKTIDLTFKSKLDQLKKNRIIKKDIYDELSLINKLRNNFAHDYYYDIGNFNVSKFKECKDFYMGLALRRKHTKALVNLKTLQFFIFPRLLGDLTIRYAFLSKLRTKKKFIKYYEEQVSDKVEKLVRRVEELTRDTNLGVRVKIEVYNKKS